jgi:2-haloalkanoic acid dehalogenase type II
VHRPVGGVLFDLLMAIMDSMAVWSAAAGDLRRGLAWRDAVTARMVAEPAYAPYEDLVVEAAGELGLPQKAATDLFERWHQMSPWPDAAAITRLTVPYAFVTNCSKPLAAIAVRRSGLKPAFVLSAEEAGCYKPDARIYREACHRLGSPPERTLFVAGSVYDSEGAHRAGLRASLVVRRADQRRAAPEIRVAHSLEEIVTSLEGDETDSGA